MFLMHGFGVPDGRSSVISTNGRPIKCPHFSAWRSMLIRVYDERYRHQYPAYEGCSVDERWRLFSEFKAWREKQDWEGKHLDKDFLVEGNRVYGPDTCAMISRSLNTFIIPCGHPDLPPGVIYSGGKFKPVRYTYPYNIEKPRQEDSIFDTPEEAHAQWIKNKHEIAMIHSRYETDERVVSVLKTRWAPKQ